MDKILNKICNLVIKVQVAWELNPVQFAISTLAMVVISLMALGVLVVLV